MITEIGFPEKLKAIAKHKSLSRSVGMISTCCKMADQADIDRWQGRCLDTLMEIMCCCCHQQPDYLAALRNDTLLLITELKRDLFLDLTPSTHAYAQLCSRLQAITRSSEAPLPGWVMGVRKSGRRVASQAPHAPQSFCNIGVRAAKPDIGY